MAGMNMLAFKAAAASLNCASQSSRSRFGYAILPSHLITEQHKVVAHCETANDALLAFMRAVEGKLQSATEAGAEPSNFCVIEFPMGSKNGDGSI